jgi:hypothetical protein
MPEDILDREADAAEADAAEAKSAPETADRRRPGRPGKISPALIELLRWRPGTPDTDWEAEGSLRAAQGILIGTIIGLLSWVAAIVLIRGLLG